MKKTKRYKKVLKKYLFSYLNLNNINHEYTIKYKIFSVVKPEQQLMPTPECITIFKLTISTWLLQLLLKSYLKFLYYNVLIGAGTNTHIPFGNFLYAFVHSTLIYSFFAHSFTLCWFVHSLLIHSLFAGLFTLCSFVHYLLKCSLFAHSFTLCSSVHYLLIRSLSAHSITICLIVHSLLVCLFICCMCHHILKDKFPLTALL